jgi:hypothetical protein
MTQSGPFLLALSVPRVVLLVAVACVFTLMVVPYAAIEFLREEFAWADGLADLVDGIVPGGDLDHVIAFGTLGGAAWFAFPRAKAWRVGLALLALGAVSEIVQVWAPGRHPAAWHAILDAAGGLFGFGAAWLLHYAFGANGVHPTAS